MSPKRALALVPLLAAAACSEFPKALLDQALELDKDAKEARAEVYAPDAIRQAEEAIAAAEAHIADQKAKKIPFLRNYDVATAKLNEAMAAFEVAVKATTEQKTALKDPVRAGLKEATLAVNLVEQELAKLVARRPKEDLTPWRNEVAALRGMLAAAGDAVKSQDYITAKAKLDSTLTESAALQARLREEAAGR
jgi:hypothetical protein